MRQKTVIYLKKIHDLLIENNYMTTKDIKSKCHISNYQVYKSIRLLRMEGIGIIPTKKGYILSEFASRPDDVGFIRKCFGRRTSDLIALQAAQNDIQFRWNGVEDKNNINQVFKYLSINPTNQKKATDGIKYLLSSITD